MCTAQITLVDLTASLCTVFSVHLQRSAACISRGATRMPSKEPRLVVAFGKSHLLLVFLPLLAMLSTPALSCFSLRAPFSSLNVLP